MSNSGNQKSAMLGAVLLGALAGNLAHADSGDYAGLLALFQDWRAFERPSMRAGAPDYRAETLARKHSALAGYRARCAAIDPSHWPIAQQVDYQLVRAEMNGLDFELRVLKPWERDPAFYSSLRTEQSDTPAHEGPNHYGVIELWTYPQTLASADERRLSRELAIIPPLLAQARGNLTGNAHDLWVTGTGTMKVQLEDLTALAARTARSGPELRHAVAAAIAATAEFVRWLEAQAPTKTGPSGVGKENYTWSQQHVHLLPLTWDQEVTLLQRELARAHASLAFEEQRNRALPQLTGAVTAEEYQRRAAAAITKYMNFLQGQDLLTAEPYLDAAMRAHIGDFVPEEKRNFFQIASHIEPMTLFAHFYHWFDHAWMEHRPNPSPVRRQPLLSNIWDTRSEGMATAMEELILRAGYYDDEPRAREIVYVMLAQRCARGLASLYAQADEFDIAKAKAFQVEWTPRGWMRPDLDLLGFEQQLYLRQPGYGSSYVTGKDLIDELIKDRAHQLGKEFSVRRFFDEFNGAGMVPVSMIRWQLTGTLDPALAVVLGAQ